MGRFRPELICPFPEQPEEDRRIGDRFCAELETFLKEHLDANEVDRTGEIPEQVLQGLKDLGCFGMKIPKEYGGLGLSQVNYNRAVSLVATHCASTSVWLSAHQSIGVPQPLKLFGSEEQKRRFFPRLAKGAVSAFALTEPDVGSDPASMQMTATPTEDGTHYRLNGQKLWCTNGPKAEIFVVMAMTPPKTVGGKERKQITAFIVERSMPGIEVIHRCEFMGLKGIQNGLLRFTDVKVPRENILWGLGKGLKLALVTLNTGRLTLPAACAGINKQCLRIVREWANERVQWGAPIGRHDAVAGKIASIAAYAFATEAVSELASGLVDRGGADIRLEAAMAKLFATEAAWRTVDDAVQIRGGRGYETALSLKGRGERPHPIERMLRDCRVNTIIEGSSEIMRLFIAREALDDHMKRAKDLLEGKLAFPVRMKRYGQLAWHYARWYPRHWIFWSGWPKHQEFGARLGRHLRYIDQTAHRLARGIFHAMMVHQAGLEHRQRVLGRLVNAGTELFAMAASLSKADAMVRRNPEDQSPAVLADFFCREARRRVASEFRGVFCNDDARGYRLARKILGGRYGWMEQGIVINS
jgi:alkylation response protein AidB-like acyl-CoA dehydrogenase